MPTVRHSFVRQHLRPKSAGSDTGWKAGGIPPRFSPYDVTKPLSAEWEWRAVTLICAENGEYQLLFEVNPRRDKWKAMLISKPRNGVKIAVLRYEDQPGRTGGGVHCHAHCDQLADLTGSGSVNMCYTLPEHGRTRRRRGMWTKENFVNKAAKFFGVTRDIDQGKFL